MKLDTNIIEFVLCKPISDAKKAKSIKRYLRANFENELDSKTTFRVKIEQRTQDLAGKVTNERCFIIAKVKYRRGITFSKILTKISKLIKQYEQTTR